MPVQMAPRWIGWVVASTLLPALPWVILGAKGMDKDPTPALVMLAIALIVQLVMSIFVAIGLSQKRSLGVGGIVGLSIVFMLASLAIGTGVFFAACVAMASLNFH
jgi:hypothetical protein